MSSYARQYLSRPGGVSFGAPRAAGGRERSSSRHDPGGGVLDDDRRGGRDRFSREAIFPDYHHERDGDDDDLPIEGSIHASDGGGAWNLSQVTLSQLSDGTGGQGRSQRSVAGGGAGAARSSGGFSRRGGDRGTTRAFRLPDRSSRASVARGKQRELLLSQSSRARSRSRSPRRDGRGGGRNEDDDDDETASLRSSQPLLSQSRGGLSQSRSAARAGGNRRRGDPREHEEEEDDDDASTLASRRSQPLLSPPPSDLAPRRLDGAPRRQGGHRRAETAAQSQSQLPDRRPSRDSRSRQPSSSRPPPPSASLRTPSSSGLLRGPSALRTPSGRRGGFGGGNGRNGRSGNTALRTAGTISSTLASLPTPSRALRAATGLAARTAASCLAAGLTLTPFRRGRAIGRLGSSAAGLSTAGLSMTRNVGVDAEAKVEGDVKVKAVGSTGSAFVGGSSGPSSQPGSSQPSSQRSSAEDKTANLGEDPDSSAAGRNASPDVQMEHFDRTDSVSAKDAARPSSGTVPSEPTVADKATGNGGGSLVGIDAGSANEGTLEISGVELEKPGGDRTEMPPPENRAASSSATATGSAAGSVPSSAREDEARHADAEDAASKASAATLDVLGTAEEVLAASRELKRQRELLEASRWELSEAIARAAKAGEDMRGAALASMESTRDACLAALRTEADARAANVDRKAREEEASFQGLVARSSDELRQEGRRAVDAVAERANEATSRMTEVARVAVEAEVQNRLAGAMDGILAEAKREFREWLDRERECGAFGSVGGGCGGAADEGGVVDPDAGVDEVDPGEDQSHLAGGKDGLLASSFDADNRSPDKENMAPGQIARGPEPAPCKTPLRYTKPDPKCASWSHSKSGDRGDDVSSSASSPSSSKKSTPLPRCSMSTSTTPFSKKATPLQNNYAKNKLSARSSASSKHAIDVESELHDDFLVVKSPFSAKPCLQSASSDGFPGARNVASKSKIAKKASLHQPKHRVNAPNKPAVVSVRKETKQGNANASSKQTPAMKPSTKPGSTVTPRNVNEFVQVNVIDKTPKANLGSTVMSRSKSLPNELQRKRKVDSVAALDALKSPRRSKRLKEANRVEQMVAQSAVASNIEETSNATLPTLLPNKVTPKENHTSHPLTSGGIEDIVRAHSSSVCKSTSGSVASNEKTAEEKAASEPNGLDSLLGTSVSVPVGARENLVGLDGEVAPPDKVTLSSLLPFGGFKKRRFNRSRTLSKKKKSTFNFEFY